MADGSALHGAFHGARTAASGDIQAAQAELIADLLGKIIFLARNGVSTPANHQLWGYVAAHDIGVAQNAEDRVGDAGGAAQVEGELVRYLVLGKYNIAQGGEQVIANAHNHAAVDKGLG